MTLVATGGSCNVEGLRMLAKANSELPSLPQIVLRMVEACDVNADFQDLSELVGTDTALSGSVLALANSAYFRRGEPVRSLPQAMFKLGIENLKTLVITVSLRQLLLKLGSDQWEQLRDFWRHSLTTALLARALAQLTDYGNPEEAFLIGMLHNVGQLLALREQNQAEKPADLASEANAISTAVIGATMASEWGLTPIAADAIRYQHRPPGDILDTPHLVKLISVAARLAQQDKPGVDAAEILFGLTAALTREIRTRIDEEVAILAQGLGIPLNHGSGAEAARELTLERLIQRGIVNQVAYRLRPDQGKDALCQALLSATELLSDGTALILLAEEDWLVAGAVSGWPELDLRLPRQSDRSLVTRCAATLTPQLIHEVKDPHADLIVDQELINLLNCRAAYAVPITASGTLHGIIVAGFGATPNPAHCRLLDLLATRAGPAFQRLGNPLPDSLLEGKTEAAEATLQIRELIHEVSNPLTVIRNCIDSLQSRLRDDHTATSDLEALQEELDRITVLLTQSRDLQEAPTTEDNTDLVREVQVMMELLETAFFNTRRIDAEVQVPAGPVRVAMNRGALRQIILNLARNAVEAMPEGGSLTVVVRDNVLLNGKLWVELTLEDSGPGLPPSIYEQLFKPVISSKGKGHSGLGLSIVKHLVDDTDSLISCYTSSTGTEYRILTPASKNN